MATFSGSTVSKFEDTLPDQASSINPVDVLGDADTDRFAAAIDIVIDDSNVAAVIVVAVPTDTYIERFIVGAMSADAALTYFRRARDSAVITGGDRSAIQTAALEAPGVRCLILTGGYRPSGQIMGTAERTDVPILVSTADTLTTIERAEAVVSEGRTRDAVAVERMRALLAEHAAVEELVGGG